MVCLHFVIVVFPDYTHLLFLVPFFTTNYKSFISFTKAPDGCFNA